MKNMMALAYFLFAPIVGGFLDGLDRKLSARMQGRKGPSVWQPFYDVKKLFNKELLVVHSLQSIFVLCYAVMVVACGVMFFAGLDLLMIFFVLTTAGIFLVLAGNSTHSPYSSMGAQREILQMMAYEPMVLITAVGFYMATGSFRVAEIARAGILPALYLPGILIGFVFILTIKMRKSPFDLSTAHHAHQEMVKGVTTEITAGYLAVVDITEWYENVLLLGVVGLFFLRTPDAGGIVSAVIGALAAWFLEILIDNTSGRVTWKTMLKAAWAVTLVLGGLNLVVLNYL